MNAFVVLVPVVLFASGVVSCRECNSMGAEPNVANPSGICMRCGTERFGVDPIAQEHYDRTGEFLLPGKQV